MLNLVVAVLGVVAVFVGLVIVLGRLFLGRSERSVAGHFDALDFILSTGLAPPGWSDRYHRRIARMENRGAEDVSLERYRRRVKRNLISRLRRLEQQASRSSVFGAENASTANTLRFVRQSWSEGSFDDFAPE